MGNPLYRNYGIRTYDLRVETEVLRIVEVLEIQEKIKTVFEVKGKNGPVTCIYWDNTGAKAGDKVMLTGFLKDGRFITKKVLITEKGADKK